MSSLVRRRVTTKVGVLSRQFFEPRNGDCQRFAVIRSLLLFREEPGVIHVASSRIETLADFPMLCCTSKFKESLAGSFYSK